ncbi:GNAT family N-acetyltransferase [Amycolatopsis sp. NBC_00355]|uniref:GNAT family N-acetyltransferase n=1 Tax=Amycolatopsis sp. NBC_00355 TaxID=2975957 RepID=UPI002E273E7B
MTSPEDAKSASRSVRNVAWSSLTEAEADAIRAIYEDAFPATERRVLAEVVATSDWLWVAKSDDTVTGFATAALLPTANAALLQYLAVVPRFQSAGIGSLLLACIERDLCDSGNALDGVYIEIEPLDGPDDGQQTERRYTFYLRWGAEPVIRMQEYFIADFSSASPSRVPMLLLWRSLSGAGQPGSDRLRDALSDIYESEYSQYADPSFFNDILGRVRG